MLIKKLLTILGINDTSEELSETVSSPFGGTWQNIMVKRVGSTVSVYIDNVLIGSQVITNTHLEMDSDNRVGRSHFNNNDYNGEMKLLHFYNYALEDSERDDLYNEEL